MRGLIAKSLPRQRVANLLYALHYVPRLKRQKSDGLSYGEDENDDSQSNNNDEQDDNDDIMGNDGKEDDGDEDRNLLTADIDNENEDDIYDEKDDDIAPNSRTKGRISS